MKSLLELVDINRIFSLLVVFIVFYVFVGRSFLYSLGYAILVTILILLYYIGDRRYISHEKLAVSVLLTVVGILVLGFYRDGVSLLGIVTLLVTVWLLLDWISGPDHLELSQNQRGSPEDKRRASVLFAVHSVLSTANAPVSIEELSTATGYEPADVESATAHLVSRGTVRKADGEYELTHPGNSFRQFQAAVNALYRRLVYPIKQLQSRYG